MSGKQDTGQEKSHEATPGKLDRARKKGDLPRSQDAQTAAAYLGLAVFMLIFGAGSGAGAGETLTVFLGRPDALADLFFTGGAQAMGGQIVVRLLTDTLGLLMAPGLVVLGLLTAQRAIVVAPSKIKPQLSRISPISNAKQKYGPHGLVEFLKSSVKLTAVGLILGIVLWREMDNLAGFTRIEPRLIPQLLDRQFWNIMTGVLVLALAVAAVDVLWQRHSHLRKMRMTHQELKDESKQTEGDPQMRASRRDRAREIANNRMLHDVPKADVVITNPSHYAVALKWDRKAGTVPVCLAKGTDEVAARIRAKAEQSGVPLHADPPTARSIHALVQIGQPIMPDHFKAVAAAIVFADKMRAQERERRGDGRRRGQDR